MAKAKDVQAHSRVMVAPAAPAPTAQENEEEVAELAVPPVGDVPVDQVLNATAPVGDYTSNTPTTGVVLDNARQSSRAVIEARARGEQVVTVMIPKDFTLHADNGVPYQYKAGIDEMPISHANHWWAKQSNGVEIYQAPDSDTVR